MTQKRGPVVREAEGGTYPMWILYYIECKTANHIYVGISNNIELRFKQHSRGRGSKFCKLHGFKIMHILDEFLTEKEAKIAERNQVRKFDKLGYIVAGASRTATTPKSEWVRKKSFA